MKKMSKESAELFNSVRDFLNVYLPSQKGVSPNTVRSYKITLTQVLDFAKNAGGFNSLSKLSWNDVTRETVESFLSGGEERRGWSPSTRNQRLTAIKSFMKYASERDITVAALYREVCLIPLKKCAEKPVEFFSENALKAILAEPDTSTRKGIRDLTLMIVLYDTGARVQELLDLRIGDLNNLDGKDPSVRLTGKGRKTRVTPIMDGTAKRIRDYLVMFHKGSSEDDFLFFVTRKGENYTHSFFIRTLRERGAVLARNVRIKLSVRYIIEGTFQKNMRRYFFYDRRFRQAHGPGYGTHRRAQPQRKNGHQLRGLLP